MLMGGAERPLVALRKIQGGVRRTALIILTPDLGTVRKAIERPLSATPTR